MIAYMLREPLQFIHHQWPRCFLPHAQTKIGKKINNNNNNSILYINATPDSSLAFQVTLDDDKSKAVDFNIIWSSSPDSLNYSSYISKPELIEFPTEVPGQNAYAYFYPPTNPIYQANQGEKPPLLLESHGKSWSCMKNDHILSCTLIHLATYMLKTCGMRSSLCNQNSYVVSHLMIYIHDN